MRRQADSRLPTLNSVDAAEAADEQLVRRAGQGCAAWFEELCRRYQVPLLDWFRFHGHGADGEDLLQETLMRVHGNLHRFDPLWRFSTWVFIIACRIAINHHQRFRVPADSRAMESAIARDSPSDQQLTAIDHRQCLWDVVRRRRCGSSCPTCCLSPRPRNPRRNGRDDAMSGGVCCTFPEEARNAGDRLLAGAPVRPVTLRDLPEVLPDGKGGNLHPCQLGS